MKHFNRDDASSSSSSPFWSTLTPPVTPRRGYFRHQQKNYCGPPVSSTLGRNFGSSTFHPRPRTSHLANISGFGRHTEDGQSRFRDTIRPPPDFYGPEFAEQPNDEYEYLDSVYKESSQPVEVPIKRTDYTDEELSKNPHRRYYPSPDDINKNDGSDFASSSTASFPFSNKRSNSPRKIAEKLPPTLHNSGHYHLPSKKSGISTRRRWCLPVAVFVIVLLAVTAALIVVTYLLHRNTNGGKKFRLLQKIETEDYRSDDIRSEESTKLTGLLASGMHKSLLGNDTEFVASVEKVRRLMPSEGNALMDAEDNDSGGFGRFISSLLSDGWRFEESHHSKVSNDYRSMDPLLEPRQLLTLRVTARKVCLFEVSTSEQEQSRQEFRSGHISGAQLLFYSSLSHNGVPVHPLQFQRYIRSLGVDTDCHVVVYDRGEHIWAAYAFWIFKLYDFPRLSLLKGGLRSWRLAQRALGDVDANGVSAALFHMERGPSAFAERLGTFQAMWNARVIATFDDVSANFESRPQIPDTASTTATLVDTQHELEFEGRPVDHSSSVGNIRGSENLVTIYGHIRGAVNLAVERLYDFEAHAWRPLDVQRKALAEAITADGGQPLILYDGTSLRSAMAWFSLHRLNALDGNHRQLAIYFGSWPEWIIRAPDYLKIIPQQPGNSSQ